MRKEQYSKKEMFERYLKCVTLCSVSILDEIDNIKYPVSICIVHDSSGYNPLATMAYSQGNQFYCDKMQDCLEEAYEALEDCQANQQTQREANERFKTIDKKGYDPLTEAYDGSCFFLTVEDFYEVIENCKRDSKYLAETLKDVIRYNEEEEEQECFEHKNKDSLYTCPICGKPCPDELDNEPAPSWECTTCKNS